MSDERGTLRHVAWREVFPWLELVGALRLALRARMLLLAAAALLLTMLGWSAIGWLFSGTDDPSLKEWTAAYRSWAWGTELDQTVPRVVNPTQLADEIFDPPELGAFPSSPFEAAWWELSAPFRQLFDIEGLSFTGLAFLLLCGLWVTLIWAFFGGALTRMATLKVGREESIGWKPALAHARAKCLSYFSAPLLPLLGVLLITLPMALLGLAMRSDVGVLIVALIWPILLVGGLLMAIFLLGLFFGWPLMWAAISTEASDSFDALSRAYSYVYQRPLYYLFYAVVATLLGLLGALLVYYFATAVIQLTFWAVSWGTGNARIEELFAASNLSTAGQWGVNVIRFWLGFVKLMALAFTFSYFWSASTVIYLLLRYHVDGTEFDEVFVDEGHEPHGLPTLSTDPAGVPIVPETTGDIPPPPEATANGSPAPA
jgi:hypothetical protein